MENKKNLNLWLAFVLGMTFMIIMAVIFDRISKGPVMHQQTDSQADPSQHASQQASLISPLPILSPLGRGKGEGTQDLAIYNQQMNRPYLGIDVLDRPSEQSVLIEAVSDDSPAQEAGLKRGDVIVAFDHRKVGSVENLSSLVNGTSPGEIAKVVVERNARRKSLYVKMGKAAFGNALLTTAGEKQGQGMSSWGLTIAPVTEELRHRFGMAEEKGVVVVGVVPGSAAQRAGFREGDLIRQVNRRQVRDMDSFFSTVDKMEDNNNFLFDIKRGVEEFYLSLKMQPTSAILTGAGSSDIDSDEAGKPDVNPPMSRPENVSPPMGKPENVGEQASLASGTNPQYTGPSDTNRPQSGGMIRPYTIPSHDESTNRPIYVPGYDNTQSGKSDYPNPSGARDKTTQSGTRRIL